MSNQQHLTETFSAPLAPVETLFSCPHCGLPFNEESALKKHLFSRHSGNAVKPVEPSFIDGYWVLTPRKIFIRWDKESIVFIAINLVILAYGFINLEAAKSHYLIIIPIGVLYIRVMASYLAGISLLRQHIDPESVPLSPNVLRFSWKRFGLQLIYLLLAAAIGLASTSISNFQ